MRDLSETLEDVRQAGQAFGARVGKVFVADGDALVLPAGHWEAILAACRTAFPRLSRVSAYATARNLLEKEPAELERLRTLGLTRLYVGPETGDEETFRRIAKGAGFEEHAASARRARGAGLELSAIFLLGVGGAERSQEHAEASARLATEMDPEFLSLLTLTVVPGTPQATLQARGRFTLPPVERMLGELRTFVDLARPRDALFRTNHASNHLALGGRLPRDRERILAAVDGALAGEVPLRPAWTRGL